MNNINNIDDINNISTDYAEFIQDCFNMKKWLEDGLENRLDGDEYAESEKE